jgi:hypothetical protein
MMLGIAFPGQLYANEFKVGFAELPITPNLIDEWEDINNDAQFDPDIDEWTDVNGNNQFDAVWMAGFQNKRAAQGIRDDLTIHICPQINIGIKLSIIIYVDPLVYKVRTN